MTWHADHRGWTGIVAVLLVVAGVLVATWSTRGADAAAAREVELVVRDMAFYLPGQSEKNPVLRLVAGETVRMIVRNDAAGYTHDFAIPDWHVATKPIDGPGSDVVTFTVPARSGRYEYRCNPHAAMMRGVIDVR